MSGRNLRGAGPGAEAARGLPARAYRADPVEYLSHRCSFVMVHNVMSGPSEL